MRLLKLLLQTLLFNSTNNLKQLIVQKVDASELGSKQRAYYLTVAFLLNDEKYENRLEQEIQGSAEFVKNVFGFLSHPHFKEQLVFFIAPQQQWEKVTTWGKLIEMTKSVEQVHFHIIDQMVSRLGELEGKEAQKELERLLKLDLSPSIKSQVKKVFGDISAKLREVEFKFLSVSNVAQVLANQAPISSADLAALALDYLNEIANRIQTDGDDGFNAFWNIKTKKNTTTKKMEEVREHRSENLCRDALLTRLDMSFKPLGVRCDREGDYVGNNRADIRLSYQRFELPIEVKGEWHKELRTAAQSQLVQQYAIDPDANGYGIYLVFWFGGTEMPSFKKDDPKPNTPEALQEILEAEFKTVNPQRIFVRVLDVTPHSQEI